MRLRLILLKSKALIPEEKTIFDMKKYKIPSYYPAPEREYIILSIQEFIAAYNKYLSKSVEPNFDLVFQQWFDSEYRYNDIPQGEEFYAFNLPI